MLDKVKAAGLDAQISVKPTQLGLDLDAEQCQRNLDRICEKAARLGNVPVWIDMENSPYVDPTLKLFRTSKERYPGVGIAIQAYLYRTAKDIESLIPLGPAIRIVKGAYLEPPEVAYPKKSDVDENFYTLCCRLMKDDAQKTGTLLHIATHDIALTDRLLAYIDQHKVPSSAYEFAMLYGIQRSQQQRLAQSGRRIRVLISYGEYWYPVVHAAARRASGERHVRVEEPVRRMIACDAFGARRGRADPDRLDLCSRPSLAPHWPRSGAQAPAAAKTMAITFDDLAEVERHGRHRRRAPHDRVDPARAEGAQGAGGRVRQRGQALLRARRWCRSARRCSSRGSRPACRSATTPTAISTSTTSRSRSTRTTWCAASGRIRG